MSIPKNIDKEHIEKAINSIIPGKIPADRKERYYTLEEGNKSLPPKYVISIANKFANDHELDSNLFSSVEAINLLKRLEFEIIDHRKTDSNSFFYELKNFLEQANSENLKTKHYKADFLETEVKVSFGQGNAARIPWISFLLEPNTTSKGIYPVYLFYKEHDLLILAYGISETKEPTENWKIQDTKSIKEFFEENNLPKPNRYGSSFVYKHYDVNKLPSKEIMDQDLRSIISYYKDIWKPKEKKNLITHNFIISDFSQSLKEAKLIFPQNLVKRFISSLLTKPFLILTGLSGSGKTKLAQAFVQWISKDNSRYRIIPVGADWTNREPLLGFPNGLEDEKYVSPDSGALKLIMDASKEENPFFMILDEMNLSHVERYFADFLSVMESDDTIKLYSGKERKNSAEERIDKVIKWPENLFVIGTVNIDETTYMFSPKVLDRANVIEFRISETDMDEFLNTSPNLNMKALFIDGDKEKGGVGQSMAQSFLTLSKSIQANKDIDSESFKEIRTEFKKFFTELQLVGAEFGYRSAAEMMRLIATLGRPEVNVDNEPLSTDEKIDIAIMQKLLPKLHGSRKKLIKPLETLAGFCLKTTTSEKSDENKTEELSGREAYKKFKENNNSFEIKYKLSFEKIERMIKNAVENGFTSYAEA